MHTKLNLCMAAGNAEEAAAQGTYHVYIYLYMIFIFLIKIKIQKKGAVFFLLENSCQGLASFAHLPANAAPILASSLTLSLFLSSSSFFLLFLFISCLARPCFLC